MIAKSSHDVSYTEILAKRFMSVVILKWSHRVPKWVRMKWLKWDVMECLLSSWAMRIDCEVNCHAKISTKIYQTSLKWLWNSHSVVSRTLEAIAKLVITMWGIMKREIPTSNDKVKLDLWLRYQEVSLPYWGNSMLKLIGNITHYCLHSSRYCEVSKGKGKSKSLVSKSPLFGIIQNPSPEFRFTRELL